MQIYISYRRADAALWAGRLRDAIAGSLGEDAVTWDVALLDAGADFRAASVRAAAAADVMLVVIGPRWLAQQDAAGGRRIDLTHDAVHAEIAAALRDGKRVIPVLVDGATMPRIDELPADLAELALRNALTLSLAHWERELAQLLSDLKLESFVAGAAARPAASPPPSAPRPAQAPRRWGIFIAVAVVLLGVAAAVGVWLIQMPPLVGTPDGTPKPPPWSRADMLTLPAPLVVLVLIGIVAAWLWRRYQNRRVAAPYTTTSATTPATTSAAATASIRSGAAEPSAVDVFVSHAVEDHLIAQDIVKTLEPRLRCWIAPRDIPPGVPSWAGPIVEAIACSRVFVVIISGNANASKEVLREVTLANEENLPLMPVRIDEAPLSKDFRYFFATVQRLEAAGWPRDRLLADVSDGVGRLMKGAAA